MKAFVNLNDELENEDSLVKPTVQEYEASKKECEYFSRCVSLARKRQNELLDELCKERSNEKFYAEQYKKHKDIVRRYEIYEELEANG